MADENEYEYHTINTEFQLSSDYLNNHCKLWELVSVVYTGRNYTYFFKRLKQQPKK